VSYSLLDNIFLAWLFGAQFDHITQNILLGSRHLLIVLFAAFVLNIILIKKGKDNIIGLALLSVIPVVLILAVSFFNANKISELGLYNILAIALIAISPAFLCLLLKNKFKRIVD